MYVLHLNRCTLLKPAVPTFLCVMLLTFVIQARCYYDGDFSTLLRLIRIHQKKNVFLILCCTSCFIFGTFNDIYVLVLEGVHHEAL